MVRFLSSSTLLLSLAGLFYLTNRQTIIELGHLTTGFLASHFVASTTESYFQHLLRDSTDGYLAGVATWADTIRYTKWGRFTATFHFIDAKDSPPDWCGVQMDRDCKATGCVISALANYTQRSLDSGLDEQERVIAAKFVIHFIGDLHQPLHVEDVSRGGNGIKVNFDGHPVNLHHVWDTSIAEKLRGIRRGGKPYQDAKLWAADLAAEIRDGGRFAGDRDGWIAGLDVSDPIGSSLVWASESNAYVCTTVLPDGVDGVLDQDLSRDYYEKAAPVVEVQIARAGYRMAAWLDLIANAIQNGMQGPVNNDL